MYNLRNALEAPPEILQLLLNLCEFMERNDRALPIEPETLGGTPHLTELYSLLMH